MSADNSTASGSSGFSPIWALFRIAGIIVGAITLLKLASIGFNVQFRPFFTEFIEAIRGWVETIILLPLIEAAARWCLDQLRNFGWQIPDLADHWRQVFTLTWLLIGSIARNIPANFGMKFVGAGVCAAVAGVAAGTEPLASNAAFVWPLAALCVFLLGLAVAAGNRRGLSLPFALFSGLLVAALYVLIAFVIYGLTSVVMYTFGLVVDSHGLLVWAVVVLGFGLILLAAGKDSFGPAIGLDIIGAMGLALGIGYVMMK